MAGNTNWNPSDKAAGITLTGSNLIATNNNNAISNVRAANQQTAGKFYWETTYNVIGYARTGAGVAISAASLTTNLGAYIAGAGVCGLANNGIAYRDGATAGFTITGIVAGSVICFAFDVVGQLIWFRLGAAGNWNASGTANPATGAGGVSVATIIGAVFPIAFTGNTNDQITGNFGDTSFVGAVPSGFIAGWPAAAVVVGGASAKVMILA